MAIIIKSVELTDFMSYTRQVVNFTAGVNAIRGLSDAGKSNIVYAIGWALFDVIPVKVSKTGEMIRRGASSCSVRVTMSDGSVVSRSYGGGGRWVAVIDGVESNCATAVKAALQDHFGVKSLESAWSSFVAINQFGVMSGFDLPPSKRKAHFDAVIGISDYHKAWKNLAPLVSSLQAQVSALDAQIDDDPVDNGRIDDLRTVVDELRSALNDFEADLKSKQADMDAAIAVADKNREIRHKIGHYNDELSSLTSKLAVLESQLATDTEAIARRDRAKQRMAELHDDFKTHESLVSVPASVDMLRARLKSISQRIDELQSRKNDMEPPRHGADEWRATISDLREKLSAIKAERDLRVKTARVAIEELEENIRVINVSDVCPVCGSPISDEHRRDELERLNTEIANHKATISDTSWQRDIAGVTAQIDAANEELLYAIDYERASAEESHASSEIDRLTAEYKEIEADLKIANEQMVVYNNTSAAYSEYMSLMPVAGAEIRDISDTQQEIQSVRFRIANVKDEVSSLESLLADDPDIGTARVAVDDAQSRYNYAKQQLIEAKSELESALGVKSRVEKLQSRRQEIMSKLDRLKKMRKAIRDVAPIVGASITSTVSREANKLFAAVWERKSAQLQWGTDYAISITVDGDEAGFATGGGMQVTAALAIRLALAQVLSRDIGFIVADEVSMGAMDDGILHAIPQVMKMASSHAQVITISHGGLFDDVASNVIHVEYSGGRSVVN